MSRTVSPISISIPQISPLDQSSTGAAAHQPMPNITDLNAARRDKAARDEQKHQRRVAKEEEHARDRQIAKQLDDNAEDDLDTGGKADDSAARANRQIDLLLRYAERAEIFRDSAGSPHARVPVNGHVETVPVTERSGGLRAWLTLMYHEETGTTPSTNAMARALEVIRARAEFTADTQTVYVRTAYHDGALYLDLANKERQVVKVTANGWQLIKHSPVNFRRPNGVLPLPEPARGGSLDELRPFINVHGEDDWMLCKAWLIGTLMPKGAYPLLNLNGGQGTAKSSASKYLRSTADPNVSPIRKAPKDTEALVLAANNSLIVAYDNLSHLSADLADDLCCMATGSGFSARTHYTNDQETIFSVKRPVIFNGIPEVVTRADLAERCIVLTLDPITDEDRKTEAELDEAFDIAHPHILGALLDAVAVALKALPNTHIKALPRMADFAKWGTAAEESQGWEPGSFLRVYAANADSTVDAQLDASLVAVELRRFMQDHPSWTGTATELLTDLEERASIKVKSSRNWPGNGHSLSDHLRRLAKTLSRRGLLIVFDRSSKKRSIEITHHTGGGNAAQGDATSDASDASDAAVTQATSSCVTQKTLDSPDMTAFSDAGDARYTLSSLDGKEKKEKREEREKKEKGYREEYVNFASSASPTPSQPALRLGKTDDADSVSLRHPCVTGVTCPKCSSPNTRRRFDYNTYPGIICYDCGHVTGQIA